MSQINSRNGNTLLFTGYFPPCRVATTGANIVLSGLQAIDGVTLLDADRVLVKDQTSATQNGIYAVSSGNWVRSSDAANSTQFFDGMAVVVAQGTVNGQTQFICTTTDDPVIIGTSLITFALFTKTAPSAANSIKGNNTGSVANAADLTPLQVLAMLGAWGNNRLAKMATYPVVNADKTKTIALGGSAFYPLTFGAASGYDADFVAAVVNEDAAPSSGGQPKSIVLTGGDTFFLYPGQSIIVYNQNSAWRTLGRARYKLPSVNQTMRVNASLGSDNNGGFATGAGAMATVQAAFYRIANDFDYNSGSGVVTILQETDDTVGVHWGPHSLVGAASGGCITLDGGGHTLSCAADTDNALHLFFGSVLYVQNITLQPGTNHAAVQMEEGARCLFKAGVVWGNGSSSGGAHLQMDDNATAEFDNDYSIAGSAASHIVFNHGASLRCAATLNVNFTGNATFAIFAQAVNGGMGDYQKATIVLNGHTVTGKRHQADNLGLLLSRTGVPNTFWPGDSNGTTSNGGQSV